MAGVELPDCSKCQSNPALREAWGCDRPAQAAVAVIPDDEGNEVEYFQCPFKCVPASVGDWMERYRYIEKFPHTAPAFDERTERWKVFDRYHRNTVERFKRLAKWGDDGKKS